MTRKLTEQDEDRVMENTSKMYRVKGDELALTLTDLIDLLISIRQDVYELEKRVNLLETKK